MSRRVVWALALLGALCVVGAASLSSARKPKGKRGPQVEILLNVTPRVKARVYWGKEHLGDTPLRFKRPKDSGPVDLRITAPGYVPLNTRVYTFKNTEVVVKLTRTADQKTLFGYKKPLPPDAGVPEEFPGSAPFDPMAPAPDPGAPAPGLIPAPAPVPAPAPPAP